MAKKKSSVKPANEQAEIVNTETDQTTTKVSNDKPAKANSTENKESASAEAQKQAPRTVLLATISDSDTKHFKKILQDYCFKQRHKMIRGFNTKIKDHQKALEAGKEIKKPVDEDTVRHDIRVLFHLSDVVLVDCAWEHYVLKKSTKITPELYASEPSSDLHLTNVCRLVIHSLRPNCSLKLFY